MINEAAYISEALRNDVTRREFSEEICDKPTRQGKYMKFKAKGLSSGFTWFVGTDASGNYIEEFLG